MYTTGVKQYFNARVIITIIIALEKKYFLRVIAGRRRQLRSTFGFFEISITSNTCIIIINHLIRLHERRKYGLQRVLNKYFLCVYC